MRRVAAATMMSGAALLVALCACAAMAPAAAATAPKVTMETAYAAEYLKFTGRDTGLESGTWSNVTVTVSTGALRGSIFTPAAEAAEAGADADTSGSFAAFLGVPFAAPPVGALRWQPPQPPQSWQGVRDAKWFVHDCAQTAWQGSIVPMEEDCLYLNVWAPPSAVLNGNAAALPVMLFVHGGSYTNGGTSIPIYWGHNVVGDVEDVVIVTTNYRLGPFGFLGSEAIGNQTSDKSSGNFGLQDQRMAMQWVQRNIQTFGGDPTRVFLFGESAGAGSTSTHLVAPKSWGLFSRAGMESGAFSSWIASRMAEAEYAYGGIVASAKCSSSTDTVACLRRLNQSALIDVVNGAQLCKPGDFARCGWAPVVDGVELTDLPTTLLAQGKFSRVPVLEGSNLNEGRLFMLWGDGLPTNATAADFQAWLGKRFGSASVAQLMSIYPASAYNNSYWDAAAATLTDQAMACPSRRTARVMSAAAGAKDVFLYQFTHELDLVHLFAPWIGVCHALELPFVFDVKLALLSADEHSLAANMGSYWTSFAATGDVNAKPSVPGLPKWAPYSNATDNNQVLGLDITTNTGLKSAACDFWDAYVAPGATV